MSTTLKLFQPIKIGADLLQHRVAMAPMSRMRGTEDHVPSDIMVEYYRQRASVPGTLIIAEGTLIAEKAGGMQRLPGIWSQTQIDAWRKVSRLGLMTSDRFSPLPRSQMLCTRKGLLYGFR
jgi:NADPH2 dehydrogenase